MRIGLDFDNTLISYDQVFFSTALKKGLIPSDLPANKTAVRDYMRSQNNEEGWILLQGEVYGSQITKAVPFPGMIDALKQLQKAGIKLCLVSHKTKKPYRGPQYDLHQAARLWLEQHAFFAKTGLGWKHEQTFFELTKEEKIARIVNLGCTHYIDDLPEILEMLPNAITKILFDPNKTFKDRKEILILNSWHDLGSLLECV